MSYKCPLCLTELTHEDLLVRFCTDHPEFPPAEFSLHDSEEALPHEAFCEGGTGSCNSTIHPGVFLRHVGCHAKNPFWNGTSVDIPGGRNSPAMAGSARLIDSTTDYQMTTISGVRNTKVTHWEIGMLKSVPASNEMWFPLMLLRATSEYETINGQKYRIGALVELAGAATVGKTVLAMQAMEYDGYTPASDDNRHIEVTGYMFSRLPPGRNALNNPFLATLYYNNLMLNNESGLFPLDQTERMSGDVKVAFVAPSPKTDGEVATQRSHVKGGRRFLKTISELVRGGVEVIFSPATANAFWYTVAFYDVAGESFRQGDTTPDELERAVDKAAILVDAEEVFGKPGTSIAIANERIRKVVSERKLPHCLIVTKLDLVMDRLSPEEQESVYAIAEDLNRDYDREAKQLLTSWLGQTPSNQSITQLKNRLPGIQRVFFTWTKNLPTVTAGGEVHTSSEQPRSYGLARFVCWCIDRTWNDINQAKVAG